MKRKNLKIIFIKRTAFLSQLKKPARFKIQISLAKRVFTNINQT